MGDGATEMTGTISLAKIFTAYSRLELTTVLVALKHELGCTSLWIPELHATILGTRHDPSTVWSKCDTKNKVLVTFKGADALAILWVWWVATWDVLGTGVESPHSDGLVERTRYEMFSGGAECHGVYAVLVTLLALGALDENTRLGVPDANALVQTTGSNKAPVR